MAWFVSTIGSGADTKWWFLAAVTLYPAVCLSLLSVNLTRMFTRRDEFERARCRGWVFGVLVGMIFTFGSFKSHFLDPIGFIRFDRELDVAGGIYYPLVGRAFVITGTVKETGVPGLYALRQTQNLCVRISGVRPADGQKIWAVGHGTACECPRPCREYELGVFFWF
jgi:hypothetical protein